MSYTAKNLHFKYQTKNTEENVFTLGPLDFEIPIGKITFICGRSGSGKSTLLAILGLLRTGFEGSLIVNQTDSSVLISDRDMLYEYRLNNIGFALQKGRLLPYLTLKENSEFILKYLNFSKNDIKIRSQEVFEKLFKIEKEEGDIERVINSYPEDVSGGQYQRGALARALINTPNIILADEPTGNLDVETGELTMELLKRYCSGRKNTSIVVVSHDLEYACQYADKIIILKKGKISAEVNRLSENMWLADKVESITSKSQLNKFLNTKIKDDEEI